VAIKIKEQIDTHTSNFMHTVKIGAPYLYPAEVGVLAYMKPNSC